MRFALSRALDYRSVLAPLNASSQFEALLPAIKQAYRTEASQANVAMAEAPNRR